MSTPWHSETGKEHTVSASKHPIIPCKPSPDGKTWKFWCPHCRVLHHHGAGGGHRVAHCHTDAGLAAFSNGYILALDPNGYLENLEKDATITWRDAIKIEPRLLQLYRQIRAVKDDPASLGFCANAVWYGYNDYPGFKRRMCDLVGFQAESDDPASAPCMPTAWSMTSSTAACRTVETVGACRATATGAA